MGTGSNNLVAVWSERPTRSIVLGGGNRSIRPWRYGEAHLVNRCDGRRFLDFASQHHPLGSTAPRPDGTVAGGAVMQAFTTGKSK